MGFWGASFTPKPPATWRNDVTVVLVSPFPWPEDVVPEVFQIHLQHMSSNQNHDSLLYNIGVLLPSDVGIIMNHYKDPY